MATLKINYNGTTYSMVKTSSKITTPSVYVDGGYIPCFKGDRFAEVVSGNSIYTLSPLMVNGYRLACGSRPAAKHLILPLAWDGGIGEQGGMYATGININFSDPYVTDQDGKKLSGFTTSVTGLDEVHDIILGAHFHKTYSFSGTAKVLYNNQIILQSDYAFDVNLSLSLGFGSVHHETRQLI